MICSFRFDQRQACGQRNSLWESLGVFATIAGMNDVTRILMATGKGPNFASEELLPLVYAELRRLAASRLNQERAGQTLTATALVHEAWLRLVGDANEQCWDNRGHFFAAAAEAMRRILIDRARHRKSLKAGGDRQRIGLTAVDPADTVCEVDLLALDEALERLAALDQRKAQLVKLRFFAGLTMAEAARVLGVSQSTADNDWAYARSWLKLELEEP